MPETVDSLDLQPLRAAEHVRRALDEALGAGLWTDPWGAVFEGEGWMAEVSLSVADPIRQVMLRISGSGDTWTGIKALCVKHGWRAVDIGEWAFVD
jgi:hypothetical protein